MKKLLALVITFSLMLVGSVHPSMAISGFFDEETDLEIASGFTSLSDPELLQYIEDSIYANLAGAFSSDDYVIEEVNTIYISNEYLEEHAFNSKTNVFFGYSLAELDARFIDTRYVFTLGNEGKTSVKAFEFITDDTYDQLFRNIAIGTGVILICITVSVVSAGLGAPTISAVFAASAKGATTLAIRGAAFGSISAGIVKGIETNNFDEAIKAAALGGSEGFKWGAIVGTVSGGATKLIRLRTTIPSPRESELEVLRRYKGVEQKSFIAGKEVPYATPGSTRPDVIRIFNGLPEYIEVKNYDLNSPMSKYSLSREVLRQITERSQNLPDGSLQRVVLDVRGRKISKDLIERVVQSLKDTCSSVYTDLPIDVLR